jgi:leucyl aminopeptidase
MRKAENISEKQLIWPVGASKKEVDAIATSTFLVRDLISTPAQDCGPHHLESVIRSMATEFGGSATVITGDALLEANYRQIHAVGRAAASDRAPRLLDLTWGDESHPKVTLVGKGVCFDTGGLNIKPSSGMLTMRKDMGGAAQTIGLARLIMATGVPVRLRLLVPAVENAISGDAFRPGDILTARNGKTSEIGNTDAEGRLVLADALVEASSEEPSLIVDCATLTGAARVALGTDVPVMFCNDDSIADDLMKTSAEVHDQVWRLPLWEGYRKMISSKFADLQVGLVASAVLTCMYLTMLSPLFFRILDLVAMAGLSLLLYTSRSSWKQRRRVARHLVGFISILWVLIRRGGQGALMEGKRKGCALSMPS